MEMGFVCVQEKLFSPSSCLPFHLVIVKRILVGPKREQRKIGKREVGKS